MTLTLANPQRALRMLLTMLATVLILIAVAASRPAHSQTPDVNCSGLRGLPLMCLKNASAYTITGVQAISGMTFGQNWIPIPGGDIRPGGTAIVKFPAYSGGCIQTVFVRNSIGATHPFPNVNVCESVSFTIRW